MLYCSGASIRLTNISIGLLLVVVPVCIYLYFFLLDVHAFAQTLKGHIVSEADLSPGYQVALNASLHSIPCCEQARWTPSKHDKSIELIPRIIHQTWKTDIVPEGDWTTARNLCLDFHRTENGWEHMFWTDETAREFIVDNYPEFLSTFDGYLYDIQRVDSIRYFLLYHYGGVYIDLDVGCSRPMEPILKFPAFLPKTGPSGVSNDVMGSKKNHPFLKTLIDALEQQGGKRRVGTKYSTVFFTTGPMFVNRLLASYWASMTSVEGSATGSKRSADDRVMILPSNFYCETFTSFFMHFPGSSWHGTDAKVAGFISRYSWPVILLAFVYAGHRIRRRRLSRAT